MSNPPEPPPESQQHGQPPPYGQPLPGAQPPGAPPPGYGPPGYAQPPPYGQAPPGYGPPGYPPPGYPGYPAMQGTNGFAIASLVCAFLCSPLGLIFGFIARSQIRQSRQSGDGLALAGIIISAVSIVAGIIFWVAVAATTARNGIGFSRLF